MDHNPGMLLWLWLLIAPPVAMALMSGLGSRHRYSDDTVHAPDARR
jgi:hypothetical protein